MEVGQQDVIVQQAAVQVADVQHPHGIVCIAMHDDGCALRRLCRVDVDGVQLFAAFVFYIPVAQGTGLVQTVYPHLQFWKFFDHVLIRGGQVAATCVQGIGA